MKTKFLSIIIGLFATSLAMTSCLSTTDPVSYEVDGTLKAFSFDSIRVDKTHFALVESTRSQFNRMAKMRLR